MDKSANRCFSFPVFRPASAGKAVRFLGALAGLSLTLAWAAGPLQAETWTDATGKHTIEADFVRVQAGEVHLKRKADGVTITVPFKQLSAESQQLARSLHGRSAQTPATPTGRPSATAGSSSPPANPAIDGAARLAPVAEFLDAGTVAVGHLDLTKIDLGAALQFFRDSLPAAPDEAASLAVGLKAAAEIQRQLIQAGAPELYLVYRMDAAPTRVPATLLLVAPVSAGKDPQTIVKMLPPILPQPPVVKGSLVLLAPGGAGESESWLKIQRQPRPDFVAPFQAAGNTALQLAVIPFNDGTRRSPLGFLTPDQPSPAWELRVKTIATAWQKAQWAVLTVNAPPQPAVAVIAQMEDDQGAAEVQGGVKKLFDLVRGDPQLRRDISQLDELAKLLTPTIRDRQLRVVLTGENGGVKTVLTAVAQATRAAAQFNQAQGRTNSLNQIGLALHNFYDTYKKFPAQASHSQDGKPLLSWRVAVLPFVGAVELYQQFHLDEPWDSAHNKQLIARMPAIFASPELPADLRAKGMTTYVVPVGPGTIFGGADGTTIASITDGTSNTIMLVEAPSAKAVVWTKPDDLEIDPKDPRTGLTGQAGGSFNVLMADGAVQRLKDSIDPQKLGWLFQRNDGHNVSVP